MLLLYIIKHFIIGFLIGLVGFVIIILIISLFHPILFSYALRLSISCGIGLGLGYLIKNIDEY